MSNLTLRLITGTIFIGVLLAGLFINSLVFILIFSIPLSGALVEYLFLLEPKKNINLAGYGIFSLALLIYYLYFLSNSIVMPAEFWLIALLPLVVFLVGTFRQNEFINGLFFKKLGALLYILLPFALMQNLVHAGGDFNGKLLFYIFLFIWMNDSFAYVFGVKFGKHKMFPAISPKKSWEGGLGGLFMVILTALIIALQVEQEFSTWAWLGFGAVVTVSATIGDFFESYLKRKADVKDSGTMLPGHGGFLDRFDSTLFAVPCSVVYLHLVNIL